MSRVVVIPKGGRAGVAAPALLFVVKPTLKKKTNKKTKQKKKSNKFSKVGVIPKEGRAQPRVPVHLLV